MTATRLFDGGFTLVRSGLSSEAIEDYIDRLKDAANDMPRWTLPDGVARRREFWPLIFSGAPARGEPVRPET